ncbi:MAG TPA: hypothetical protein VI229_00195 [Burkholderiales bacterium]
MNYELKPEDAAIWKFAREFDTPLYLNIRLGRDYAIVAGFRRRAGL